MDDRRGIPPYLIYIGIFVVVFIVALGVFLYTSQSKTKEFALEASKYKAVQETEPASAEKAKSSPTTESLKLTVAAPEDNSFVNTNSIKVAGATKAGTTVSITGGAKDVVNEVNSDGSFALDVSLNEGENDLVITVYDQSGQQKTTNKTVVAVLEG